jgi:hypothetical protein
MRKTLFTFLLTIISIVAYSQARLGYTASEIKSEFWESRYKLTSGYTTDKSVYYITIVTNRASVIYYFDTDKVCTLTIIAPDDQGALNYYVELYNRQYVIVSSTKWKMYTDNGFSNVELIYPDDGGYYFTWYYD